MSQNYLKEMRVVIEKTVQGIDDLPRLFFDNTDEAPDSEDHAIISVSISSVLPASRGPNPYKRVDGFFTIDLYTKPSIGTAQVSGYLDTIQTSIKPNDKFNNSSWGGYPYVDVNIESSEVGVSFNQNSKYITPVTFYWFSYYKE